MHLDTHLILQTLVVAIGLGILAQLVAHRLKLPAILPLLLCGMAVGPFGLGLFDPAGLGAEHLEVLVHLGVAIILFEGGMSLNPKHLRSVSVSLRNILVIGTAVTWVGAAWLARALTGIGWHTAALFGAIVTVTGPTVIMPLLRHMIVPRKVRTVLLSEGLMIDPIGAVLAYFVLQVMIKADLDPQHLAQELVLLCLWGCLLGFAGGALARMLVRYRHTGDELRSLAVLAILVSIYLLGEHQAEQSGILASVVMGLTVAASDLPDLNPVRHFKGQLTVLIISVLFILLAARLDLQAVVDLGWRGALVVAGLILIVRPLSVFLSVPPSRLDFRQRIVLALTAPRGIVAAAVASLSAIQLQTVNMADDAAKLEGLVYLTILVTCTWATIMAPLLPRFLGYLDDPSRRRIVMVGVNPLSVGLASLFDGRRWTSIIVDSSRTKLDGLRGREFRTVAGDARDTATYEDASVERDTKVLALTSNDELNMLIANVVRDEFGVEHPVIVAQRPHDDLGRVRGAWVDLLGGDRMPMVRWNRLIEDDKATLETLPMPQGVDAQMALRSLLRDGSAEYLVICTWSHDKPDFHLDFDRLGDCDELTLLIHAGTARNRLLAEIEEIDDTPTADMPELNNIGDETTPADQEVTEEPRSETQ